MADQLPAPVSPAPLRPGVDTSEFRLTKLGVIIGIVLQVLALVLDVLPQVAGEASWLPTMTFAGGTVLQTAALFGYQVSRGLAKSSGSAGRPPAQS